MTAAVAPSTRKLMKLATNAMQKARGQEAINLFKQVLAINPNHAEALYKCAYILHSSAQYGQASELYQRAILADPLHLQSYMMLCRLLETQNRGDEVIRLAQQAVHSMPLEPQAHCNLASTLIRYQFAHEVPRYLEGVMPQFPDNTELKQFYCIALKVNNQFASADEAYAALIAAHRVPATFRILYETYLPRLYESSDHIDAVRAAFEHSISKFITEKPRINIMNLMNYPLFALAFHNRDNKALLQNYTRMLRLIDPTLNYTAKHCKASLTERSGPLRIGFLSTHMHNHSVGNSYRTLMIHLANQPDFSVTFFNLSDVKDEKILEIREAGVPMVSLPKNILDAYDTVAHYALDILIYPDIGMDAMTHYMAMARLAPHQVCLHGHPETTGIDTIDYVIASRLYEPPHASENYTERLLCVDGVTTIPERTPPPERLKTREELGLPLDKTLYVCPMAIQKFHPDYDGVLADILARDPNATLILFNDFQLDSASKLMHQRVLKRCDPSRVIFMPWMRLDDLISVMKACDAVLDTIYFGGGTTAQIAFSFGIPIVTMPGRYTRGRAVYSFYQVMQMEHDAPIACDTDGFVDMALKVANDKAYAATVSQRILERNHLMFESTDYGPVVVELMHDIMNQDLNRYNR